MSIDNVSNSKIALPKLNLTVTFDSESKSDSESGDVKSSSTLEKDLFQFIDLKTTEEKQRIFFAKNENTAKEIEKIFKNYQALLLNKNNPNAVGILPNPEVLEKALSEILKELSADRAHLGLPNSGKPVITEKYHKETAKTLSRLNKEKGKIQQTINQVLSQSSEIDENKLSKFFESQGNRIADLQERIDFLNEILKSSEVIFPSKNGSKNL